VNAMSIIKQEKRLGGQAGQGGCTTLSSVQLEAIDNANRGGHDISGKAVQYGSEQPVNFHTGEISQSDLDIGLHGHPHDLDPHKSNPTALPDLGPNK
jgi:hypothetical protein